MAQHESHSADLNIQNNPQVPDMANLRQNAHLEIYAQSSMLVDENDLIRAIWFEGKQTPTAQERYRKIVEAFENGFFVNKIEQAKSAMAADVFETKLSETQKQTLGNIVASVNAQRGRALVEILLLQLTIKSIAPAQDIRLHKGSRGKEGGSHNNQRSTFSWAEGISMRRLDDSYIVPVLRTYGLLRMNEYGAFMTRTFAENYPYTAFYKAEISGARRDWLLIIEDVEENRMDAEAALLYMLDLLWKVSEQFKHTANEVLHKLDSWITHNPENLLQKTRSLIKQHIHSSESRARLLEIAMHSLLQALEDMHVDIEGVLKPLMPMRTANLKHRNFGDIEVLNADIVIESWDAKYDNPYLSDALDVLTEKLRGRDVSELRFGYVLLPEKKTYADVDRKIAAIAEDYGVTVQVYAFDDWVQAQVLRAISENVSNDTIAVAWIRAYVETLALRREKRAPIDEPTFDWLKMLNATLV